MTVDLVELLIEQSHTLGRIEANLEHGARTHRWLIDRTLHHGDTLIRHGEAIDQMRRERRSQRKEPFKLSIVEMLEIGKAAWPYIVGMGLILGNIATALIPWVHSLGTR